MRRVIAPGIVLGLLTAALAPIVAAAPAVAATTTCADGTCTVRFDATGAPETFTVPSTVDEVTIVAAGAQGGSGLFNDAAGLGGTTTGTLAVDGDTITVVVGSRGGYGGGGASGAGDAWYGGNGGGGTFVFASDALVAVAGGGGGAAGGGGAGGAGGGVGAAAGDGGGIGPGGAGGAAPGAAGGNGSAGTGPATAPGTLGDGGRGGDRVDGAGVPQLGGGGGGGWYGGGGGAGVTGEDEAGGGGGGSGYAASDLTGVSGTAGTNGGDGFVTITYAQAQTSLTIAVSGGSTVGDAVQLTATLADATPAQTGTVSFTGPGIEPCSAPVDASGVATCASTYTAAGQGSLTATYGGDATYAPASAQQSVLVDGVASSVTLTNVTDGTQVIGDAIALRAAVASDAEVVTGTVTFAVGSTELCTVAIDEAGIADCVTSTLPAGVSTVVATYSGDAVSAPATSAPLDVVIARLLPQLNVGTLPGTGLLVGDEIVLVAYLAGGPIAPTGSVTLTTDTEDAGPVLCGTFEFVGGYALCSTTLPAGTTVVTASYSGDERYSARAVAIAVEVAKRPLALTVSAEVAASGVVTATATASDGATPAAVAFLVDGVVVPGCESAPIVDGGVTCEIRGIPAGQHEITVRVADDATYADAQASTSITIAAAPGVPAPGAPGSASLQGSLPQTGAEPSPWLIALAMLLMAAGVGAVAARRVRRA